MTVVASIRCFSNDASRAPFSSLTSATTAVEADVVNFDKSQQVQHAGMKTTRVTFVKKLASDDDSRIPACCGSSYLGSGVDGASYVGCDVDSISPCECIAEEERCSNVRVIGTGVDGMPIEPEANCALTFVVSIQCFSDDASRGPFSSHPAAVTAVEAARPESGCPFDPIHCL